MDDARKRKLDVVIVWRFDRFARSTRHLLSALEEFRTLGVQFISYSENIDTSSALGQALFTIISAVAQLERELIRERVSAGVRNARENGKKLGRPARDLDLDVVSELRAKGASLRLIAQNLGVGYGTLRSRLAASHDCRVSGPPTQPFQSSCSERKSYEFLRVSKPTITSPREPQKR